MPSPVVPAYCWIEIILTISATFYYISLLNGNFGLWLETCSLDLSENAKVFHKSSFIFLVCFSCFLLPIQKFHSFQLLNCFTAFSAEWVPLVNGFQLLAVQVWGASETICPSAVFPALLGGADSWMAVNTCCSCSPVGWEPEAESWSGKEWADYQVHWNYALTQLHWEGWYKRGRN